MSLCHGCPLLSGYVSGDAFIAGCGNSVWTGERVIPLGRDIVRPDTCKKEYRSIASSTPCTKPNSFFKFLFSKKESNDTKYQVKPGKYRHFKGGEYKVLFCAKDSEDLSIKVVYESLKDGGVWVRPLEEFIGITKDGIKRFEYTPM